MEVNINMNLLPKKLILFTRVGIILLVSLLTCIGAIKNPLFDWDIIGYVASIYSYRGLIGEELRNSTYEDLKLLTTKEQFIELTNSSYYRKKVYSDPESLEQQLPFYKIRIIYLGIIGLLSYFTTTVSYATILASSICGSILIIIIGVILLKLRISFILVFPAVAFGSGLVTFARFPTPDTLAALLAILALVLIEKKRILALSIIAILPLARTDYIIISVLVMLHLVINHGKLLNYLYFLISFILYLFINQTVNNYGYFTVFNFTLIPNELKPYPAKMILSTNLNDYLIAYVRGFVRFYASVYITIYLIAIGALIHCVKLRILMEWKNVVIISLLFVSLHFMAFPAALVRNYILANIICLIFISLYFDFLIKAKNNHVVK